MSRLLNLIKTALIVGTLIWVMAVAALFFFQDRFIFSPDTTVVPPSDGRYAVIEIPTSDDERLVAWYTPPAEGCPMLVFFHGNGARLDRDVGRYRRIVDRGVGLLAVSWRGYAGSTGQPSETGFHKDASASWRWLTEQGYSAGQIIVHGHSIGTSPSVFLAAKHQPAALVLESAFFQ